MAITRGIIRDQGIRRWTMFVLILIAVLILFPGATFLSDWLKAKPILFMLYWGACAWLTLAAVLLACFDMLLIRSQVLEAKRKLRREVLGEKDDV